VTGWLLLLLLIVSVLAGVLVTLVVFAVAVYVRDCWPGRRGRRAWLLDADLPDQRGAEEVDQLERLYRRPAARGRRRVR
jgi:hypothetical protein